MESSTQRETARNPRMSWSSVFAGTFVFLAIETTFGLLASAIFGPADAIRGLSAGAGIWMIVLSIIALFFGAQAATYLSGESRRLGGLYYGLVTFGLSIFSSMLVGFTIAGNAMNAAGHALLNFCTVNAVWLFITLILGGIAAGVAGAVSVPQATQPVVLEERSTVRPAA
jgi:hypothetical protein